MVKHSLSENHFVQLDIAFATEYGVNVTLLFTKLRRLGEHWEGHIDEKGKHWVRLTLEEWEAELPFLKSRTIRRTIEECEEKSLILSIIFEGRSKWYRCNPKYLHNVSGQNDNCYLANLDTSSGQNGQLPISSPTSFSHTDIGKPPQKTKELPADEPGPLNKAILKTCCLNQTMIINGLKLDYMNTIKALVAEGATAPTIERFAQWWGGGDPPTLKQLAENWEMFKQNKPRRFTTKAKNGRDTKANPGSKVKSETERAEFRAKLREIQQNQN